MRPFVWLTAALLLFASMFSAALPGECQLAAPRMSSAVVKKAVGKTAKKAADEAVNTAKALLKKAKTEEQRSWAEELLEYAEANAAAAARLETAQDGDGKLAAACIAIAKEVNEAATVLAEGKKSSAGEQLNKIAEMTDGLQTTTNANTIFKKVSQKNTPQIIPQSIQSQSIHIHTSKKCNRCGVTYKAECTLIPKHCPLLKPEETADKCNCASTHGDVTNITRDMNRNPPDLILPNQNDDILTRTSNSIENFYERFPFMPRGYHDEINVPGKESVPVYGFQWTFPIEPNPRSNSRNR